MNQKTSFQQKSSVEKINVLWITAGLGCDGESVAITAATQPSIEDIVMGGLPGVPEVCFINPFYSFANADEYIDYLELAASEELDPFILVIEGSIPNEQIKDEGYWAALGTNKETGQPITTCEWIDRLAPKAWAVMAVGTCATYGGIHAMEGNPTGAMGLPDYLGWDWKSKGGIPIVCVPGCPTQRWRIRLFRRTRRFLCEAASLFPCSNRPMNSVKRLRVAKTLRLIRFWSAKTEIGRASCRERVSYSV